MKRLNFRKTVMRNNFTVIFGGIGKRRTAVSPYSTRPKQRKHRTKMQMTRRSHQGWRNKTFGSIQTLKIRLKYGRRKVIRRFIK